MRKDVKEQGAQAGHRMRFCDEMSQEISQEMSDEKLHGAKLRRKFPGRLLRCTDF